MKTTSALPQIECLDLTTNQWVKVQDIRQLEPGDCVRMINKDGKVVLQFGRPYVAVVKQSLTFRPLHPGEYDDLLRRLHSSGPVFTDHALGMREASRVLGSYSQDGTFKSRT